MSPALAAAHAFAARWHAGQTDKAGRPYLLHLEDVAQRLGEQFPNPPMEEIQAALLHDVLEDTACTEQELSEHFGARVTAIVKALTKQPGTDYLAGIRALAAKRDRSVLRIKLADNLSNASPARAFAGSQALIAAKYAPARAILEDALRDLG